MERCECAFAFAFASPIGTERRERERESSRKGFRNADLVFRSDPSPSRRGEFSIDLSPLVQGDRAQAASDTLVEDILRFGWWWKPWRSGLEAAIERVR